MVSPADARALGLVQEINRLYLHPMGYALGVQFITEVPQPGDPGIFFLSQTADPEGFVFEPVFEPHEVDRGHVLADEYRMGTALREANLGFANGIQPLHQPVRSCRECGCTDDKACEGGCSWVEVDLCSACAGS